MFTTSNALRAMAVFLLLAVTASAPFIKFTSRKTPNRVNALRQEMLKFNQATLRQEILNFNQATDADLREQEEHEQ